MLNIVKSESAWGFTGNIRLELEGIASEVHQPAKPSNMWFCPREHAGISNPPPQVNELFSKLCIDDILCGNSGTRVWWSWTAIHSCFWREEANSNIGWIVAERKPGRQRRISKLAIDIYGRISGRRVAAVVPIGRNRQLYVLVTGSTSHQ